MGPKCTQRCVRVGNPGKARKPRKGPKTAKRWRVCPECTTRWPKRPGIQKGVPWSGIHQVVLCGSRKGVSRDPPVGACDWNWASWCLCAPQVFILIWFSRKPRTLYRAAPSVPLLHDPTGTPSYERIGSPIKLRQGKKTEKKVSRYGFDGPSEVLKVGLGPVAGWWGWGGSGREVESGSTKRQGGTNLQVEGALTGRELQRLFAVQPTQDLTLQEHRETCRLLQPAASAQFPHPTCLPFSNYYLIHIDTAALHTLSSACQKHIVL